MIEREKVTASSDQIEIRIRLAIKTFPLFWGIWYSALLQKIRRIWPTFTSRTAEGYETYRKAEHVSSGMHTDMHMLHKCIYPDTYTLV